MDGGHPQGLITILPGPSLKISDDLQQKRRSGKGFKLACFWEIFEKQEKRQEVEAK